MSSSLFQHHGRSSKSPASRKVRLSEDEITMSNAKDSISNLFRLDAAPEQRQAACHEWVQRAQQSTSPSEQKLAEKLCAMVALENPASDLAQLARKGFNAPASNYEPQRLTR